MVFGFPLLSPSGSSCEFLVARTPACKFIQQILVLSKAISSLWQQAWEFANEAPQAVRGGFMRRSPANPTHCFLDAF